MAGGGLFSSAELGGLRVVEVGVEGRGRTDRPFLSVPGWIVELRAVFCLVSPPNFFR